MRHTPVQAWATKAGLLALPPRVPIDAQGVAAHVAISQLFARYGIAHDELDFAAMADLFCVDALLEVSLAGPAFERHQGRDAITANFARVTATQTDQRRHAVSNVEITLQGDSTATARAYGLVSAADGRSLGLVASCAYTADAERGADGLWRFARLWIGMDDYVGKAPGTDD